MEFVLHRFNQIGKLFPEQAGSAIGRMTGGNGIDAGALQRLCCLAADGADARGCGQSASSWRVYARPAASSSSVGGG